MRRKFDANYASKVLNALEGIKMQFSDGISSSELKERLARFGIAHYSNVICEYVKHNVFTKIGRGPKTKYLIHAELKNIIAAHESISGKKATQAKQTKHNWVPNQKAIDIAIELLERNNYFVRKIRPGVIYEFKEIIKQ